MWTLIVLGRPIKHLDRNLTLKLISKIGGATDFIKKYASAVIAFGNDTLFEMSTIFKLHKLFRLDNYAVAPPIVQFQIYTQLSVEMLLLSIGVHD